MPAKEYMLTDALSVKVYKRKSNRSLRLSISATGSVRVTIPAWAPYRAGYEFAKSRLGWIEQQRVLPKALAHGQAIGKAHRLELIPTVKAAKTTSRIRDNVVTVSYPSNLSAGEANVQAVAQVASIRALRAQSEMLLPQRLKLLAETNGFSYSKVSVKRLKGRWGSCDSRSRIVLNLFLMQLPWELIDYVLIHELCHTKVLRHGPDFWREMEKILPNTKILKKQLKTYQPVLDGLG